MRCCNLAILGLSLTLPLSAMASSINLGTGSSVTGNRDNNYTAIYNGGYDSANATPKSGGSSAFAITNNPAWLAAAAGYSWIGPDAGSATSSTDAGGFYTYTTTFLLNDNSAHDLFGSLAADNIATIYLNGVNTGVVAPSFNSLTSFDITQGFRQGVNTLQFVVQNGNGTNDTNGPTGLYTNASVSSTPEPSSLALMGTGLASIVGVVRKRRQM